MKLGDIAPYDGEGALRAVVEAPRGYTLKPKWDGELGAFVVSRALPLGIAYPFDWGFVPGTLAEDGDPLDVLVLNDRPTCPGMVVPCRAIGVVEVEQLDERRRKQRNDRLVAVFRDAEGFSGGDGERLSKALRAEIEAFFVNAAFFTAKHPKVLGWKGVRSAADHVSVATRTFRRTHARKRKRK